jgi:hypothetical protein
MKFHAAHSDSLRHPEERAKRASKGDGHPRLGKLEIGGRSSFEARASRSHLRMTDHFFDGQGAPQGAQAPAKSSGETARPLDGLTRWLPMIAANPSKTTTT